MQRRPVINAHCHFINNSFIPDAATQKYIIDRIPSLIIKALGAHIKFDEQWLEDRFKVLAFLFERDNVKQFLINFAQDIEKIADYYISTMDDKMTCVDICCPQLMDLAPGGIQAYSDSTLNVSATGIKKYETYIDEVSQTVKKYPFRIMPFVMFDPRRKDAYDLCTKAILEKGFIGIKMYPAMGYSPSPIQTRNPDSIENPKLKQILEKTLEGCNREEVAENLEKIYKFCTENKVPITVHCGLGGSYDLRLDKSEDNLFLTDPENWEHVMSDERYRLKVNFAHLGSDYLGSDIFKIDNNKRKQTAYKFAEKIKGFMQNPDNKYFSRAFTDLSCQLQVFKETRQYFKDLEYLLKTPAYENKVIFGTDYPFSLLNIEGEDTDVKNYTVHFRQNLESRLCELVMQSNPIDFLFENNEIPQRYLVFIGEEGVSKAPAWVKQSDWKCFV